MLCANTRLKGASCKLKPSDVADPLISHAQNSGASPPLAITHPNWLRWPSGPEFDHEYPQTAREHRLSGQADLACRVDASGLLINCFVANESPAGYGFGKAALKLSVKFRMKPAMENGVPLAGEHVFLPIDFQGN
jgi:protein TonB